MTPKPMEGLSKEERRQRALEMLKAKPRNVAEVSVSERERELEAREWELQVRARELQELERQREAETKDRQRREKEEVRERERQEALEARERALEAQARELEERERRLVAEVQAPPKPPPAKQPSREPVEKSAVAPATTPAPPKPAAASRSVAKPKGKMATALLQISGVDVHYGKIQALRGLNISIKQGEVVALLGANGAGKSSTLRAISGMVAPSSGDITFNGEPIGGRPSYEVVKHGISHVPEGRELFPTLAVEENLRLGYWPQRKTGARTLKEALDRVYTMFPRLGERRAQAAGTMSGGEQQMLAFGRALMSSPKLLLVDEMSLGLAPLIVQTLFDAVEQINSEGASVIIVEQFVHKALQHAQRAYVLSKGEIVLEAASAKLRHDPNLLAAYLGGAEGHIEDASPEAAEAAHAIDEAPRPRKARTGAPRASATRAKSRP